MSEHSSSHRALIAVSQSIEGGIGRRRDCCRIPHYFCKMILMNGNHSKYSLDHFRTKKINKNDMIQRMQMI